LGYVLKLPFGSAALHPAPSFNDIHMTTENQLEQELHRIERWFHGSTEPFDDWE
jgi:hypothetical protein